MMEESAFPALKFDSHSEMEGFKNLNTSNSKKQSKNVHLQDTVITDSV